MNDNKFEYLGSLKEYCNKYGRCVISYEDTNDANVKIKISSEQEIEINILCSRSLSDIIRNKKELPTNIYDYNVLRIINNNGTSYIRLSQVIEAEGDPSLSLMENMEKFKDVDGNVKISFKIEDLNLEPPKPIDIDWFLKK
nr:hypothetical protein [uncultured Flavobacterium sp.]